MRPRLRQLPSSQNVETQSTQSPVTSGRVPSLRELMDAHDARVAEAQAKRKREQDATWKPYHRIRKVRTFYDGPVP